MDNINEYVYVVEGFSNPDFWNTPEFSNAVKTLFGALLVKKRFESQGLIVEIREHGKHYGLNPYYEKDL